MVPGPGTDFFTQMSVRLVGEGGLISEQALQAQLHLQGLPCEGLADWLARGQLRSFSWGGQRWLPRFQLTDSGFALRSDVAAIADELAGAMDELEILAWFVCPNEALDRRTPLASMRASYREVLEVARMDHFLASA